MKKAILLILSAFIYLTAGAQAQVNTKRYILSDFKETTMDVILTGNEMTDALLRTEIQNTWHISPYEFCTETEFSKRKKSSDYYFLMVTDKAFGQEVEPGIRMLSLFKGTAKAGEGLDKMFKVTSIPFCGTDSSNGEETSVLPILLNILQKEVERIMERTFNPTTNVTIAVNNKLKKWGNSLIVNQRDLNFETGISLQAIYKKKGIIINADEDQDKFEMANAAGSLVGYVVAPEELSKGSVCFTMILNPDTDEIYYIHKRYLGEDSIPGFTQKELRRFFIHLSK